MTQVVVEIPTIGLISVFGKWGQEDAIFSGLLDVQDRIDFFSAPTIMSDDPRIVAICAQSSFTVNDIIGHFGAHED